MILKILLNTETRIIGGAFCTFPIAKQDKDGELKNENNTWKSIIEVEEQNLINNEIPIAKERNEGIRKDYTNVKYEKENGNVIVEHTEKDKDYSKGK